MNTQTISSYQQQAIDFANKYGVKLTVGMPSRGFHFDDDKDRGQTRYSFPCKISRGGKSYSFKFGQSIAAGDKKPTMYDVLCCMEKYGYADFQDFCDNLGYNNDSRKALKTFKAVQREYAAMARLFSTSELNEMAEIQ